jgi:hypothetical protein
MNVTLHVARNASGRSSAVDGRTTRHAGYDVSQRVRKRSRKASSWRRSATRFRGLERVGMGFTLAAAAYNLRRLPKVWRPHERPGQLRTRRRLADRRGRPIG